MSINEITFTQGELSGIIPAGAGGEVIGDITFDAVWFSGIKSAASYPIIGGGHIFMVGDLNG